MLMNVCINIGLYFKLLWPLPTIEMLPLPRRQGFEKENDTAFETSENKNRRRRCISLRAFQTEINASNDFGNYFTSLLIRKKFSFRKK